jgi:RNA polymerase sigma-70 factor (ECF subfamily)
MPYVFHSPTARATNMDAPSFPDLLRRVRGGDPDAAADLVRRYEQAIRRAVRMRLTDARLRRTLESMDVCQSVFFNFFVRAAAGQFDLERPEQLLGLLVRMAQNRVQDHARREQADRRDGRRLRADGDQALAGVADRHETPSQEVAGRDLLERVRSLMSDEERYLMDQRRLGRGWAELAAEAGTTPDALRVRYDRALDRVARQVGLDEVAHG